MGFGPFVVLSIFYALIGLRVVGQLARHWRATFDRHFTAADRSLVDQTAFFVLVPISVALHEFGHAVAIWLLGGRVESWGYYLFAGFVGYDAGDFSPRARIVVAAAGTLVNLLLAAVALGVVFGTRPPMRAAFNELLLQFTLLSLINAFILYPALDLFSGLNGDWTQMYRGGEPLFGVAIGIIHAAVLGGVFWVWRSEPLRQRMATLTDAPPGLQRLPLGQRRATPETPRNGRDATAALQDAAGRVADGWLVPVEGAIQKRADGMLLLLSWRAGDLPRSVIAWAPRTGGVTVTGITGDPAQSAPRAFGHEAGPIDVDRLTLRLRLAMEAIDAEPSGTAAPRSSAI